MFKILEGIRVLDLSNTVLGPLVTQVLGDLGADIIKIEPPDGDVFRQVAPARNPGMGANFMNINRNKRSIALDLKTKAGMDILLKLVRTADVFFHNMRPSAVAKLGIGYDDLVKVNDSLIYCTGVGFGEEGPYADYPAYDDIIQGLSGIAYMSRNPAGEPKFTPTIIADKITGLYNVYGILSALFHRTRTGKGMEVAAPMFECMTSFMLVEHLFGKAFEPPLGDAGYERVTSPYRKPYRTADGFLAVLPYTTKHWQGFFRLVGRFDLADQAWVCDHEMRSKNINLLYEMLEVEIAKQTNEYWLTELKMLGIPHGRINSLDDLFEDPHLKAGSFFQHINHPSEGRMVTLRQPVSFKGSATAPDIPAPRLGQHNREILSEIGFSSEEINALESSGVLSLKGGFPSVGAFASASDQPGQACHGE